MKVWEFRIFQPQKVDVCFYWWEQLNWNDFIGLDFITWQGGVGWGGSEGRGHHVGHVGDVAEGQWPGQNTCRNQAVPLKGSRQSTRVPARLASIPGTPELIWWTESHATVLKTKTIKVNKNPAESLIVLKSSTHSERNSWSKSFKAKWHFYWFGGLEMF